MKKIRMAASALAVVLVGTLLAGTPAVASRQAPAPSSRQAAAPTQGKALQITYRGVRPSMRRLARLAPTGAGGPETQASIRAEIPFLVRAAGPPEGAREPAITLPIPRAANLPVSSNKKGLVRSWEGLNHFDNRFSDGGNQFSSEPPDQGLCVGNGYVMETVNSVVQVYNERGKALIHGTSGIPGSGPVGISTNEFYGYPSAFDRTNNVFGPQLFDVSCYYDQATHRWFHLTDTLQVKRATGAYTGKGSIDLAVSKSANPLGSWTIYRINTQNDGTGGTPNHGCDLGPCFADFPHIGADANGIYLTTNEYAFFGDSYSGAQLYALSKHDLVAGSTSPGARYFENLAVPALGQKAFTLRAVQSRPSSFVGARHGVEYFLSSTAGDGSETGNTTGGSNKVVVWGLSNTASLNSGSPAPALHQTIVKTLPYVLPPLSLQRDKGPLPLLRCINQGVDCVGDPAPFHQRGPYPLDSSDTRMMSAFLDRGTLWGTLDTSISGRGGSEFTADNNYAPTPIDEKAGVLYFAIHPRWRGTLRAGIAQQGYLTAANANLIYPSLAMGSNGSGFIGVTLVGPNMHPSAAYMKVGLGQAPTVVRVAAAGVGPDDGFTGTFEGDFRPRWGDYGYAVPGRNGTVWFAAEYIAQRCSFDTFLIDPTCGNTRSFFANWSTRVSQLRT